MEELAGWWFWYRHDQDLFYACDQMSEDQFALPTFVQLAAIVGVQNVYDYPDTLLELVTAHALCTMDRYSVPHVSVVPFVHIYNLTFHLVLITTHDVIL